VKKRDSLENQVKIIYLGLGSNLGNRELNLEKAKYLLQSKKIKIIKISNFYESESWPNIKFPKYLNIILKVKTYLSPLKLFALTKSIEKKLGRKKTPKNYPRKCDIDIIDYNSEIISMKINNNEITIPHPKLHNRNFVLVPLNEVANNWKHPKFNQNISNLLSKISIKELRSIKLI